MHSNDSRSFVLDADTVIIIIILHIVEWGWRWHFDFHQFIISPFDFVPLYPFSWREREMLMDSYHETGSSEFIVLVSLCHKWIYIFREFESWNSRAFIGSSEIPHISQFTIKYWTRNVIINNNFALSRSNAPCAVCVMCYWTECKLFDMQKYAKPFTCHAKANVCANVNIVSELTWDANRSRYAEQFWNCLIAEWNQYWKFEWFVQLNSSAAAFQFDKITSWGHDQNWL